MKYFVLIFISLITLVIITSCGLIRTSSADKEKIRIADEYGGIYVFDKVIRDEIIALQKQELKENDWSLYYQKVKEYMGEEIFEKLKKGLAISSYYVDKNGKVIPITMFTYISTTITTYGLYGDEGAGFRLTDSYSVGITGDNIFYLENGKFIKSDETREAAWN